MTQPIWPFRPIALALALLTAAEFTGCQPAEVGTVGRESASDELPTGPDPSQVKGKRKPASNLETRATRK